MTSGQGTGARSSFAIPSLFDDEEEEDGRWHPKQLAKFRPKVAILLPNLPSFTFIFEGIFKTTQGDDTRTEYLELIG